MEAKKVPENAGSSKEHAGKAPGKEGESSTPKFSCGRCGYNTRNKVLIDNHNCDNHQEDNDLEEQTLITLSVDEAKRYHCSECDVWAQGHAFEEHLMCHIILRPYQCLYCSQCFVNRRDIGRHVVREHAGKKMNCALRALKRAKGLMKAALESGSYQFYACVAGKVPLTNDPEKSKTRVKKSKGEGESSGSSGFKEPFPPASTSALKKDSPPPLKPSDSKDGSKDPGRVEQTTSESSSSKPGPNTDLASVNRSEGKELLKSAHAPTIGPTSAEATPVSKPQDSKLAKTETTSSLATDETNSVNEREESKPPKDDTPPSTSQPNTEPSSIGKSGGEEPSEHLTDSDKVCSHTDSTPVTEDKKGLSQGDGSSSADLAPVESSEERESKPEEQGFLPSVVRVKQTSTSEAGEEVLSQGASHMEQADGESMVETKSKDSSSIPAAAEEEAAQEHMMREELSNTDSQPPNPVSEVTKLSKTDSQLQNPVSEVTKLSKTDSQPPNPVSEATKLSKTDSQPPNPVSEATKLSKTDSQPPNPVSEATKLSKTDSQPPNPVSEATNPPEGETEIPNTTDHVSVNSELTANDPGETTLSTASTVQAMETTDDSLGSGDAAVEPMDTDPRTEDSLHSRAQGDEAMELSTEGGQNGDPERTDMVGDLSGQSQDCDINTGQRTESAGAADTKENDDRSKENDGRSKENDSASGAVPQATETLESTDCTKDTQEKLCSPLATEAAATIVPGTETDQTMEEVEGDGFSGVLQSEDDTAVSHSAPVGQNSDNTGEVDSQDKGEVDSRDKGEIDSRDKGEIDSHNKGEIDSQDKGEVASRDKGEIDSHNKGEVDSQDKGEVDSRDKGEIDSRDKGEIDSRDKGEIDSHNKGEIDSRDKGEIDSRDKGEIDSRDKGEIDSRDKGEVDSHNKGEIDSHNKGETDSHNKGETDSQNKGETDLQNQGEIQSQSHNKGETDSQNQGETDSPCTVNTEGPVDLPGNETTDCQLDSQTAGNTGGKTDLPSTEVAAGKTDLPNADDMDGKIHSPDTETTDGKMDLPCTEETVGKIDSRTTEAFDGETNLLNAENTHGETDSLNTDSKTDSPNAENTHDQTDSLNTVSKTDSPNTERTDGQTDSLNTDIKADSLNAESTSDKAVSPSSKNTTGDIDPLMNDVDDEKVEEQTETGHDSEQTEAEHTMETSEAGDGVDEAVCDRSSGHSQEVPTAEDDDVQMRADCRDREKGEAVEQNSAGQSAKGKDKVEENGKTENCEHTETAEEVRDKSGPRIEIVVGSLSSSTKGYDLQSGGNSERPKDINFPESNFDQSEAEESGVGLKIVAAFSLQGQDAKDCGENSAEIVGQPGQDETQEPAPVPSTSKVAEPRPISTTAQASGAVTPAPPSKPVSSSFLGTAPTMGSASSQGQVPGQALQRNFNFFVCGFNCGFSSLTSPEFRDHLQLDHAGESSFSCFHCGYQSFSEDGLVRHISAHAHTYSKSAPLYICGASACKFGSNLVADFVTHQSAWHPELTMFHCHDCDERFGSVAELLKHFEANFLHIINCPHCTAKATERRTLLNHIASAHPGKPKMVSVAKQIVCRDRKLNGYVSAAQKHKQMSVVVPASQPSVVTVDSMEQSGNNSKNKSLVSILTEPIQPQERELTRQAAVMARNTPVVKTEKADNDDDDFFDDNYDDSLDEEEYGIQGQSQGKIIYMGSKPDDREIDNFKCKFCTFIARDRCRLEGHERCHGLPPSRKSRFKCMYCPQGFNNEHKFNSHVSCHPGLIKFSLYCCKYCDFDTNQRHIIIKHVRSTRDQVHLSYTASEEEMFAVLNKTMETRVLECTQCSYMTRHRKHLVAHLKREHSSPRRTGITVDCDIVEKYPSTSLGASRNRALEMAMSHDRSASLPVGDDGNVRENQARRFKCPICQYLVPRAADLKAHVKRHSEIGEITLVMFRCKYCSAASTAREIIYGHLMEKHLGKQIALVKRIVTIDTRGGDNGYAVTSMEDEEDGQSEIQNYPTLTSSSGTSDQMVLLIPDSAGETFPSRMHCPCCQFGSCNRKTIIQHVSNHHPEVSIMGRRDDNNVYPLETSYSAPSTSSTSSPSMAARVTLGDMLKGEILIVPDSQTFEEPVLCPKCDYATIHRRNIVQHLEQNHPDISVMGRNDYPTFDGKGKDAEEANATGKDGMVIIGSGSLDEKIRCLYENFGDRMRCMICQAERPKKFFMHVHILRHLNILLWGCQHCSHKGLQKYKMMDHIKKVSWWWCVCCVGLSSCVCVYCVSTLVCTCWYICAHIHVTCIIIMCVCVYTVCMCVFLLVFVHSLRKWLKK